MKLVFSGISSYTKIIQKWKFIKDVLHELGRFIVSRLRLC